MKNFKEAFGSNLRNVRKSKNLTIEKFAEMLDVSPRQVTRIESGKNFPSAETLCKISTVLNVQLKNLFDIEWHDNLMYNASGKYIKPNIQIIVGTNKTLVKSLTPLTKKKNYH